MPDIDHYLDRNRELAYRLAEQNTVRNAQGRAVIPEGDEWRGEHEWDKMAGEMIGNT